MNKPKLILSIPKWVWAIFVLINIPCLAVASAVNGIWDFFMLNLLSGAGCLIGYYLAPDPTDPE